MASRSPMITNISAFIMILLFSGAVGGADQSGAERAPEKPVGKSIMVKTPTDRLVTGGSLDIKWIATGVSGNVKVIICKGRKIIKELTSSVPATTGAHQWVVPVNIAPEGDYWIWVISVEDAKVAGVSEMFGIGKDPFDWKAVPEPELEKLRCSAKLDAVKSLAEKIYNLRCKSGLTVYSVMASRPTLLDRLMETLGNPDVADPEFDDEGVVRVTAGVLWKNIGRLIEEAKDSPFDDYEDAETVEAEGSAAVPKSLGASMLAAERAASEEAFNKLIDKLFDFKTGKGDSLRTVCADDERMLRSLISCLRGLEPYLVDHQPDGECEVDLVLEGATAIEMIAAILRNAGDSSSSTEALANLNTNSPKYLRSIGMRAATGSAGVTPPPSAKKAVDPAWLYEKTPEMSRMLMRK